MSRRPIDVDHQLNIDDKVVIERNGSLQEGIIKFMGKTNFKQEYDGVWLGIEVTDGTDGKNSGDFQGEKYFDCKPGKGVFVIRSRVRFLVEEDFNLASQSKQMTASLAGKQRIPSLEFEDDDEDVDEPPPAPTAVHPSDIPPPPQKQPKDDGNFETKQITVVRGDENVTHNPLHTFNKPRYAAARQQDEEHVEATNLFRGDMETLARVEKIKLSDLDRDGTGQVNIDELQQVMSRLNKYKYRRQMYVNLCKGICVGIIFLMILLVGSMVIGHELTKPVSINEHAAFTDRSGHVLGTETFDTPLDPNFQSFAVTDKIEGFFGKYYINAEVAMVIQTQLNVYRFLTHQTNMEFILDRRENQDNLTLVIENRDGTITNIPGRPPVATANLTVPTEPGADLSFNGTFDGLNASAVGVRRRLQSQNLIDSQPVNFVNSRKWETVPEAAPGALNAVAYHIVCWSYNRDNPAARATPKVGPGIDLGTQPSMDPPFAWRFKFAVEPTSAEYNMPDWFYLGSLWTASASPRSTAVESEFAIFLEFNPPQGNPPQPTGNLVVTSKTGQNEFRRATGAWNPTVKGVPGQETAIELIVKTNFTYSLYVDGVDVLQGDVSTNGVPFAFVGNALTAFSGGDPNTLPATSPVRSNFPAAVSLEVYDMELDCQTSIVADDLFVWVPIKMTFMQANTYCRNNYKSSLPSLKTRQENDAFMNWFFQKDETTDFTWIGAAQNPFLIETQGGPNATTGWVWVDGSGTVKTNTDQGVPNNYANWHAPAGRAPEPNQYSGNAALGENCAAMYGKHVSGAGKWLDAPCQGQSGPQTWSTKFACQKRTQSCYSLRSFSQFPSRNNPATYSCFFMPNPGYSLKDLQTMCDTSQTTNVADAKVSRRCVGVSYTTGLQVGGVGCLYFYFNAWDNENSWQSETSGFQTFFENLCAESAQPSPAPTKVPSSSPSSSPSQAPSGTPTRSPTMAPTAFNSTFTRTKVVVITTKLSWFQAVNYCSKVYNGYLFQPRTLADNAFSYSLIQESFPNQDISVELWMGMKSNRSISIDWTVPNPPGNRPTTRRELRELFTWTTNANLNPSDPVDSSPQCGGSCYRAWTQPTEPDGWTIDRLLGIASPAGVRDVSCGIYRYFYKGNGPIGENTFGWFDEDCNLQKHFICEIHPFQKQVFIPQLMTYNQAKQYTAIVYGPNAHLSGPPNLNEKLPRFEFFSLKLLPPTSGPFDTTAWGTVPPNLWLPISTQAGSSSFQWFEDNLVQHFMPMRATGQTAAQTWQCDSLPAMDCTASYFQNPELAIRTVPSNFDAGEVVSQNGPVASFFISVVIPVTSNPTELPTTTPSKGPSVQPSVSPTKNPSTSPTVSPSRNPTGSPTTPRPTKSPSTSSPTGVTTASPTTSSPSTAPSKQPVQSPTRSPSTQPTKSPTSISPSMSPSSSPSGTPSKAPSQSPSMRPSAGPSKSPSVSPTKPPSNSPSTTPSKAPTGTPSVAPTRSPNFAFSGVEVVIKNLSQVGGGLQEIVIGPEMLFGFNLNGFIGDPPRCRILDTSGSGTAQELISFPCTADIDPITQLYGCNCQFDGTVTSGGVNQIVGTRDVLPNTTCAVGQLTQAAIDGTTQQQLPATNETLRALWDLSSETYAIFGMIYFALFLCGMVQEVRIYRGHALKRSMQVTATHAFVSIMAFGYMTVCFVYASFTRQQASLTLATILALGMTGSSVWTFTAFVMNGVHLIYGLQWRNTGASDASKRMIRGGVTLYAGVLTLVCVVLVMAQISDGQQNAAGFQTLNVLAHTILLVVATTHAILSAIYGSWLACKVQTTADDDELTSAQEIERAFSEFDEEEKPKGDALAVRLASVSIVFAVLNLFGAVVALIMAVTWPWAQIALSTARVVFLILPVIIQIMWLYFYFPTVGRAIAKAQRKRQERMVDMDDDTVGLEETFQGLPLEIEPRNEVDLKDDDDIDFQPRRGTNIDFGAGQNSTNGGAFSSARQAAGSVGTGPALDYDDAVVMTPAGSELKKKKRKKKKKGKKNKKKKKRDREDYLASGYGTADGEASREIDENDEDGDFYEGPVATAGTETNDIPPAQPQVNGMDDMLNFGDTGSMGEEANDRNRGDTEAVFGALPTLPSDKHL